MVCLQREIIAIDVVLRSVASDAAGAIDIFVGTTRDNADGRTVLSLDYEVHEPMALKEMERISVESKRRWALTGVAIVHRTGRVPVGEASVVIAVSAPHRAEAFEACRFIIDTLKQTVPIWKKEEFVDGSTEWSGLGPAPTPSH